MEKNGKGMEIKAFWEIKLKRHKENRLVKILETSGTGNQGRGCGSDLGHPVFASAPVSMNVESGC